MNFSLRSALILAGFASALAASPHDDLAFNHRQRAEATKLLRQGNAKSAVAALRANVRAEARGGDRSLEVSQQLVDIAFHFFSRRDLALAHETLGHAIAEAQPLLNSRREGYHASDLFCSLGLACERILLQPERGRDFYTAAATANPSNRQARERLQRVEEKIKHRQGRR